MLNWLIALILFALAVCQAVSLASGGAANMVVVVSPCAVVHTDYDVAARPARDTARDTCVEDDEPNEVRRGCRMRGRWTCDGSKARRRLCRIYRQHRL